MDSFKLFKDNVKKIAPYVIGGVLAFETCSLFGFTPFHLVSEEKCYDAMEEIGNNNFSKTTLMENVEGFNNIVQSYSEWILKDDYYYRKVVTYDNFDSAEILNKIVLQEEIDLSDYFDNGITTYEKNEYLSDEEIMNNKEFVKATIFSKDAYCTIEEESLFNEVTEDMATVFIFSLGIGIPYVIRKNKPSCKIKKLSLK